MLSKHRNALVVSLTHLAAMAALNITDDLRSSLPELKQLIEVHKEVANALQEILETRRLSEAQP